MADKKPEDVAPQPVVPQPVYMVPAPVQGGAPQSDKRLDEAPPGGRFMVNGVLVNAEGQPINEDGSLVQPKGAV